MHEILFLLTTKGNRNEESKASTKRYIFLEVNGDPANIDDGVTQANQLYGQRRILKTHLPARYLKKQVNSFFVQVLGIDYLA